MNVCYAYESDATSADTKSGRPWSILDRLRSRVEITEAFPLVSSVRLLFAPLKSMARRFGYAYTSEYEPLKLRRIAAEVARRAEEGRADVIFSPGPNCLAYLDTGRPAVFCHDTTFHGYVRYYRDLSSHLRRVERLGRLRDERLLARCDAAVFGSDWAARSAVADCGADPGRVHVVPFGSNMPDPGAEVVAGAMAARLDGPLRVLFVGKEWERKGGDIVLDACRRLRDGGIDLRLDIVGPSALPVELPSWATNHGLLSRARSEHAVLLGQLFLEAVVMFVPSRAECYGMVFCEAAAFGLPVISCATGGIPTIVRSSETGILMPEGTAPLAYADAVSGLVGDRARYLAMAAAARADYAARLNWDSFTDKLIELFNQVRK